LSSCLAGLPEPNGNIGPGLATSWHYIAHEKSLLAAAGHPHGLTLAATSESALGTLADPATG